MDSKMKYYLYVSDAKVDMLYPQIDKSLLKKIAVELSIDLKPLGAGLGATIKQNQSEETRYSKLKLVVEYVEKHLDVGWVDAPRTYFKGSLLMDWGLLDNPESEQPSYAVYFGGSTDRTLFGMIGSADHLIGNRSDVPKRVLYYTPNEVAKALANETKLPQPYNLSFFVRDATPDKEKQVQQLEFLAKTLLYEKREGGDKQGFTLLTRRRMRNATASHF
jgi:hypothetical protein